MNGRWSQRAQERLAEIRHDFAWLTGDASAAILNANRQVEWWTFAGHRANATLVPALAAGTHSSVAHGSFTLIFAQGVSLTDIEQAILSLRSRGVTEFLPAVDERAIDGLKFADCLPPALALHLLQTRMRDRVGVEHILETPARHVTQPAM
ncbi:MAG TPA: hypothetical protein VF278_07340 [Pirellulales bacterium]